MTVDVFISYPRTQREKAEIIREKLEALGLGVFYDLHDIDGGEEFPDIIDKHLRSCKAVLACWSPLYFERRWCLLECRIGLKRRVLVPVAIEQFSEDAPPADLQFVNVFDLTDWHGQDEHEGWQNTLRSLSRHLGQNLVVGASHALPQQPKSVTSDTTLRLVSEIAEVSHDAPIRIRVIDGEVVWSPKYEGRIRYKSAIDCAAVVDELHGRGFGEEEVCICTPYRSQRALLRNILYRQGLKSVEVSTADSSKGGQRRVVLVDLVEAGNETLNSELGDRFLTAALSRANDQVVFFVSQGDLANPQVVKVVSIAIDIKDRGAGQEQTTLSELLKKLSPRN